jgi:hypothetical protein
MAAPHPEIKIHKEQDIFIQVGDEHLYNLKEIIAELEEHPNIIEEQPIEQPPLTCRQRLAKNRNALIIAGVSLGSATISGAVALIVHFTAQR